MSDGSGGGYRDYANSGGNSSVIGYEFTDDGIWVTFRGGARYLYTDASCGVGNVQHLKNLAEAGQGLASYINRNVRKQYAQKA